MSVYTGIFNATVNPPQLNMKSLASHILRRQPNGGAPLYGMTAMTGNTRAKSATHGYFTKTMEFSRVVSNGANLAAAGSINVDSTSGIVVGHVLHNAATGENLRVTAVTSGTVLAVTRGFGRVVAADIADNAVLVVIGSAQEEGSARPTPRSIASVYAQNFTQIFRNAWALTDTARASYAELGYSNIQESQRDCMTFHSTDIEATLFFGQAKMDTSGATPLHSTQGIIDAVRQYAPLNVTDFTGVDVTYDDLVDAVEPAFAYSTDIGDQKTRVAFCDATAMKVLQKIGKEYADVVTMTQRETMFGMVFTEFKFYKGRVMLIEHPLFNGLQALNGLMVVVDVPAVKLAYMDGRNAIPENFKVGGTLQTAPTTVAPGVDAQGGSLTSELAVELINPQGCAVITGLTSAGNRIVYTKEVP